ncbi:complexin-4c [Oncorhynchus clarkii lewisi]|uniref:Complexin 4c n=1 Tax=Oncorhynchus mykiss TaxID=8022 RepID=A0A8C7NE78_ONCMY|nr:complexin-4c [Oncorhynchus keta]XP_046178270.1 complexin-4c [Oncorhynchus gorbuscha]XP_046178271.1 complexin-4c [Oncorhynchus gorbuscha]XP_052332040.1 complexin-4c [Oncorhynchus keta]
MSFMMKAMLGSKLKDMTGGGGGGEVEVPAGDVKETPESKGMSREEFEDYQRQLIEEKMERDKEFATKKAERANLRSCLRDKYRLPESGQDEAMVKMAGDDLDLPEDLAKMVDEDEEEEAVNDSLLGQLHQLQNMDMDQLKTKAQTTMTEIQQVAEEKCVVM